MNTADPILVALDLKPGFERTIEEARRVGKATGAALTLAHAVPVPTMPQFGEDLEGERDRAEARCRELLAELAAEGTRVTPDPVVKIASPLEVILEVAKGRPTSFVFLGDGGKAKLDRILFGANVERVLRGSSRPVWVVRPRKRSTIERLLVAVDTSRAAGEALQLGSTLARLLDARLDLFRVYPETGPRSASLKAQEAELRRYAEAFDVSGVETEYVAWEGEPGKRIVEATAARDADVLVLGSAGRRGIQRWLRQSMSEHLVRKLPCSLLSVPPASSIPA